MTSVSNIQLRHYWMGRDVKYPPDEATRRNAEELLKRLNVIAFEYGRAFGKAPSWTVSSGYRPPAVNQNVPGAARRSAHQTGEAVDILDRKQELSRWLQKNPRILEQAGLYMESPDYTPSWCHLQTRPTRNRIFKP